MPGSVLGEADDIRPLDVADDSRPSSPTRSEKSRDDMVGDGIIPPPQRMCVIASQNLCSLLLLADITRPSTPTRRSKRNNEHLSRECSQFTPSLPFPPDPPSQPMPPRHPSAVGARWVGVPVGEDVGAPVGLVVEVDRAASYVMETKSPVLPCTRLVIRFLCTSPPLTPVHLYSFVLATCSLLFRSVALFGLFVMLSRLLFMPHRG